MELSTMLYLAYLGHKRDMGRDDPDTEPWSYQEFLEHSRVASMLREPDGARYFEFLD